MKRINAITVEGPVVLDKKCLKNLHLAPENDADFNKLLSWLSEKAHEWAIIRKKAKTLGEEKYALGCMMAYLSTEAWIKESK